MLLEAEMEAVYYGGGGSSAVEMEAVYYGEGGSSVVVACSVYPIRFRFRGISESEDAACGTDKWLLWLTWLAVDILWRTTHLSLEVDPCVQDTQFIKLRISFRMPEKCYHDQ